ncbi:hypothetical protein MishRS11D_01480 [Methylomagnum ishizawai]|nr:hypothetical protein MishRS11D_01480 [Methylomagnum ishizawai]
MAQRADFLAPNGGGLLRLFISHWPSRLWCHENSVDRHLLGMRLRDQIDGLNPAKDGAVILLGDYNDEPFDDSLAGQLMATRDRAFVVKKPHLLYNPFWRHLVRAEPYPSKAEDETGGGTYFHANGETTRWRTFDQIIFSSVFLGRGRWHLNEALTGILRIPEHGAKMVDHQSIFDHFPVIGVIEKVD